MNSPTHPESELPPGNTEGSLSPQGGFPKELSILRALPQSGLIFGLRKFWVLACLLTFLITSSHANVADDFATANEAYGKRDFAQAISTYESLITKSEYRPEIFYNLGLAFEQSGNPAKAVLSFERALLLSPNFADARIRLASLSGEPLPVWGQFIPIFGSNVSILLLAGSAWLILLSLAARATLLGGTRGLWTMVALLSLTIFAAASASYIYRDRTLSSPDRAVVLQAEKLRSNFTESSPSILSLRPGQTVQITSVNGPWTQCSLPDQTRGWVPSGILERVLLRSEKS